ncbi:type II secretion system protein GspL [Colwellia sp. MEBiC06753]
MNEILYIRLASQADLPIAWLIWSTNQQEIIASGELANAGELSSLQEKAKNRQVTAIAPGQDVLLKALKMPSKSAKANRLAAPYMLEEELAQDVDDLFFAYGQLKQDDVGHNCFVAITARKQLEMWQHWLATAGIFCQKLIPETLLLPLHEHGWSAITVAEQVVIRQGQWQGVSVDQQQWQFMQNQWQQLAPVPEIHAYSLLPALPQAFQLHSEPEELPMALYAQQGTSAINLLQGEFSVKSKRSPAVKYWLIAAGLAGVALLLNLGVKASNLYQLNDEIAQIEQEIISTYKQAFPDTKRVRISTIKSQLKRKLAEAGGGDGDASFLTILSKVEPAFKQVPTLKPTTVKFDGKRNELRIQAEAGDYQTFDKFKAVLEKAQLTVSQGAQNNQDDRVTGSFSIKDSK